MRAGDLAKLAFCHRGFDQARHAAGGVDLRRAVADDVDMCRRMVVLVDDDAERSGAQHGDHLERI